jgi:transglutaminase/protease-like cytokinesis protein 3
MMKKVVSTVLAMTMVLSMAVSGSAATVKSSKKTSTTSSKTTTTTKKTSSSKTSSTKTTKTDFCSTQLKSNKLALSMHNTILKGLKANKNKITVSIKGYSEQDVYNAFQTSVQMIIDQHPEIFWLDTMQNIVINDAHTTLTFYPRPASGYGKAHKDGTGASKLNTTAIKNTTTKMNNAVKKMTGSTRYAMVKSIHDTIVNGTQYPANPNKATHNQHQAVGALVEGKAVCDGYAKAFKYACDQKGIPCMIIVGNATNNVGDKGTHAWNYVQMEDGKWYQVDTDWDDPQTKGGNSKSVLIHDYFLTGSVKNDKRVKDSTQKYPTLAAASYKAK